MTVPYDYLISTFFTFFMLTFTFHFYASSFFCPRKTKKNATTPILPFLSPIATKKRYEIKCFIQLEWFQNWLPVNNAISSAIPLKDKTAKRRRSFIPIVYSNVIHQVQSLIPLHWLWYSDGEWEEEQKESAKWNEKSKYMGTIKMTRTMYIPTHCSNARLFV